MNYLREFWKDPLQTDGRCSQKEFATIYWLSILISFIPLIGLFYGFLFIIPSFCLAVRRFHDLGFSGAYLVTLFIPGINFFMLFYLTFAQGKANTPFAQTPTSYNINYTPTPNVQYIQPLQTQYTQPISNVQPTQTAQYNTNPNPIPQDLMDIIFEDTMPLQEDVPPYKPNIQNNNIPTPSHSAQSQSTPEPTSNYKEKDLIDMISDFFHGDNSNTDTSSTTTDSSLSPEETDTLLILGSFVFCILSILLFKWPGSIGFEWLSIICGSIPIYNTYKKSHSLSIVPLVCIIISFFLFLIRLQ